MTKFEGVAIGGPCHGSQIEGYGTQLHFAKRVPIRPFINDASVKDAEKMQTESYEFITIHFEQGDISYWRHESVPSHYEALQIMLRAVEPIPDDRRQFDEAQIDAKFNGGFGYIEVDARGRVKRLDPRDVFVRP